MFMTQNDVKTYSPCNPAKESESENTTNALQDSEIKSETETGSRGPRFTLDEKPVELSKNSSQLAMG